MKKVLFIDRDGTLVVEPPFDYQLDSLEKLTFYPGVFGGLSKIAHELEYELVMVTNQDGLGTCAFPEETFWPVHNKILDAFENEGIVFSEVLIDRSFPEENAPTRKPGVGLLQKYLHGPYNLAASFVIGDRETDVLLAKNLGAKGIFLGASPMPDAALVSHDWEEIYRYLKAVPRKATKARTTEETTVRVAVNLDGNGKGTISTGVGFFDHMLEQLARHGDLDLDIHVQGDLVVDEHHTIEDVAICLGEAFYDALGSKKGIERYGFLLPMDDCLAQVALDFGGRAWLVWGATFHREKIGDMPTEMVMHFFKSFCDGARCNLNVKAEGENEHHKVEAIFKAFAKAVGTAVRRTNRGTVPSTKGVL